jgi:hypothetical protein
MLVSKTHFPYVPDNAKLCRCDNIDGVYPLRIFQLPASHGNIGKSGMFFAFIDKTTKMRLNWTEPYS